MNDVATIFITKEIDIFQLASELSSILLLKKGKEDTLKFAALLQVSIQSLRQQGYPIDRLLLQNKKTNTVKETVKPEKGMILLYIAY